MFFVSFWLWGLCRFVYSLYAIWLFCLVLIYSMFTYQKKKMLSNFLKRHFDRNTTDNSKKLKALFPRSLPNKPLESSLGGLARMLNRKTIPQPRGLLWLWILFVICWCCHDFFARCFAFHFLLFFPAHPSSYMLIPLMFVKLSGFSLKKQEWNNVQVWGQSNIITDLPQGWSTKQYVCVYQISY